MNSYYFDVNGNVGCGCQGYGEYLSVENYISHMEYLGIGRAAVWSLEARDINPCRGNENLCRNLNENAKHKDQLIPAFVITPALFYEKKTLSWISGYLKKNKAVLRIFPHHSRFSLGNIERVLEELEDMSPVILWDYRNTDNCVVDSQAIVRLAARFPRSSFILTHTMWPAFNGLLDIMWRSSNILSDISWFHMRDAIKIVCKEFGAERLVFGTGHKTNYGASISGLAFADINDKEKELIAHGNMEKMLGLPPLEGENIPCIKMRDDKPLWDFVANGRTIENVKILDAHCHSGPSTGGWLFEETGSEITIAMKKQAQRLGITRMFVSHFPALFGDPLTGNCEVAEELGKDDMFKGYFVFNPHYYKKIGKDVLDSFFRDDFFIGFKLLPSYWEVAVTDERYNAVWEYADQYRLPVLVHTWQGQFDEPSLLEKITRKYKNAFFLLGHSGGNDTGRQQAVSLAQKRKNVYLEFCGSFGSTIDWMETIKEVGFDRVVFGSDAGMHDQAWEIGRLLSIPLPDIKLRPVLGENFLKILKKRTFRASGVSSKLDCLES